MVSASSPAADPGPASHIEKKPPDPSPGQSPAQAKKARDQERNQEHVVPADEMLDDALEMTFPASDPIAPPVPAEKVGAVKSSGTSGKAGPGGKADVTPSPDPADPSTGGADVLPEGSDPDSRK